MTIVALGLAKTCTAATDAVHRINCGGPDYVDKDGNLWSADYGFNTGRQTVVSTSPSESVLRDPRTELFRTERWDKKGSDILTYALALPESGTYVVRLLFADTCACTYTRATELYGTITFRNFQVIINDQLMFERFEPIGIVGWGNVVQRDFRVVTGATQIRVTLRHGTKENPMINAIEIIQESTMNGNGMESVELLTSAPTAVPTTTPTSPPTGTPTTVSPTKSPSTRVPTGNPTSVPSPHPTTVSPTAIPTTTQAPSTSPTFAPSIVPTSAPTSSSPSYQPSVNPTHSPTTTPSVQPSTQPPTPILLPSTAPTASSSTTTVPSARIPTTSPQFSSPIIITGDGCCRTADNGIGTYVEAPAKSFDDCGRQCLATAGCLAIEFHVSTMLCELHSERITHTSSHDVCQCGIVQEAPDIPSTNQPTTWAPTNSRFQDETTTRLTSTRSVPKTSTTRTRTATSSTDKPLVGVTGSTMTTLAVTSTKLDSTEAWSTPSIRSTATTLPSSTSVTSTSQRTTTTDDSTQASSVTASDFTISTLSSNDQSFTTTSTPQPNLGEGTLAKGSIATSSIATSVAVDRDHTNTASAGKTAQTVSTLQTPRTLALIAIAVLLVLLCLATVAFARRNRQRSKQAVVKDDFMLPTLTPEWDDNGVRTTNYKRLSSTETFRTIGAGDHAWSLGGSDVGNIPEELEEPMIPTQKTFAPIGNPDKNMPVLSHQASASMLALGRHGSILISRRTSATNESFDASKLPRSKIRIHRRDSAINSACA